MFELLKREPEKEEAADRPPLVVTEAEIVFDKVLFDYEAARPILSDITFRIPPSGTVAVVGGSGSGKSTLARLLMRFYDVTEGAILVEGRGKGPACREPNDADHCAQIVDDHRRGRNFGA